MLTASLAAGTAGCAKKTTPTHVNPAYHEPHVNEGPAPQPDDEPHVNEGPEDHELAPEESENDGPPPIDRTVNTAPSN